MAYICKAHRKAQKQYKLQNKKINKYFNPLLGTTIGETNHRWEYCSHCEGPMVICGHCGNNCCNGGSGETCIDKCNEAYNLQDLEYKKGSKHWKV